MPLLPTQGGDLGNWGNDLNQVILVEHNNDGTHKFFGTPNGLKVLRDDRTWVRLQETMEAKVVDDGTVLTTGTGKLIWIVPPMLDGLRLVDVGSYITTVSTSGIVIVQFNNLTKAVNMLTTTCQIDQGEFSTYTAATPPVIDPVNNLVNTGDRISVNVTGAGTGAQGLGVVMTFG